MKIRIFAIFSWKNRTIAFGLASAIGFALCSQMAHGDEVKDLKYGVILFEFYQQKYFETLVEFDYAAARGGIQNHGDYPQLLKGGVSLSYGLDRQAKAIFSKLIADNTSEEVQNRAWFYLAKMLYLRGDINDAATTLSNVQDIMPPDIDQEYRYLAALINIKLGYFDEAETISRGFDHDSAYAPYIYFNLGVAFGKQREYVRAIGDLKKSTEYADQGSELLRLSDRAHMAIAYLYEEDQKFTDAYAQINHVSTSGIFSNRALLGSGWASVNSGAFRDALAPLTILQQRSMAVPEAQEAALLLPHVYEKLGLDGRAAEGFIDAYERYGETLEKLEKARKSLKHADILELFVRNLDEVLGESDWFGIAPSVSLNSLSPFLLDLISDHSFQSILKDLRDLYAIRNNLDAWKRKQDDFDVIIKARSASLNIKQRKRNLALYSKQQADLQDKLARLTLQSKTLDNDDQQRFQWLLAEVNSQLYSAGMMLGQLDDAPGVSMNTDSYAQLVNENMNTLDTELVKTNKLIGKVEKVILELVNAELDIHEERLKYYRVQAQLAKARILDRSLAHLDDEPANGKPGEDDSRQRSLPLNEHNTVVRGGANEP